VPGITVPTVALTAPVRLVNASPGTWAPTDWKEMGKVGNADTLLPGVGSTVTSVPPAETVLAPAGRIAGDISCCGQGQGRRVQTAPEGNRVMKPFVLAGVREANEGVPACDETWTAVWTTLTVPRPEMVDRPESAAATAAPLAPNGRVPSTGPSPPALTGSAVFTPLKVRVNVPVNECY